MVLSIARSTGAATWANDVRVNGGLTAHGGFALFNTAMVTVQPTVTGAIGGNPALASLIAALASYGLFINNTTA